MKTAHRMTCTLSLLLCATLIGACSGKQERVAQHLQKGDTFLAQDDFEKARVEYKNVLQIDPKNSAGLHGMGQVMEGQQNWRNAVGFYQRAVELDSNAVASKLRLARLYLLGGLPDKALETIDPVLVALPQNPDALAVKAGIIARNGDAEAGFNLALSALKVQPDQQDALMLVSGYYSREKKFDEAIAVLSEGLARKPKDAALRTVLAQTYAQKGDPAKAAATLREIIAAEPDKLTHYIRLAEYLNGTKNVDEAESVMRDAVAKKVAGVDSKLALAEFLLTLRGADAAEKQLTEFIAAEPKEYALRFALAHVYDVAKKAEPMKRVYADIIAADDTGKDGLRARTRLAALAFVENHADEGDRLVAEVLKINPRDNDGLMLRATRALANKDSATAVADARTVLKDQPKSIDAALLLAEAHTLNKEAHLAREVLQDSIQANPRDAKVRFALVKLLAQSGEVDKSMEQLKELVAAVPDNLVAREALFKAYAARNARPEARAVVDKIKKDFPSRALGYVLAGYLAQQQGEMAQSIPEFEVALRFEPNQMEPLLGIVKSHLTLKQAARAQQRVQDALQRFPNHPVLYNLMGEVLMVKRDYKGAETELRKAIAASPKFAMPYRNLATIRTVNGDAAGAVKIYEQGVEASGGDPALVFGLAGALEAHGDYDRAISQYEALLAKDPASVSAANNLAMMLVTYRKDPASVERAAKLAEQLRGSNNPAHLDTVGWVQFKNNDTQGAVTVLDEAVRGAPDDPLMRYHLGMALYKKGDVAGAREQLTRALNAKRKFFGVDEARAALNQIAG